MCKQKGYLENIKNNILQIFDPFYETDPQTKTSIRNIKEQYNQQKFNSVRSVPNTRTNV